MTKRNSDIVIGLGFGDEGKGTVVDYLATINDARYVIKHAGGPQCAHNVQTEHGTHHTFAQFGSGTLHGIPTIVSRFCVVNPFNMAAEADALIPKIWNDPFDGTFISENAPLATPYHQLANRAREVRRGANAHGSCGEGVGEVQMYRLFSPHPTPTMGLLTRENLPVLEELLHAMRGYYESHFPETEFPAVGELLASYRELVADERLRIESDAQLAKRTAAGYNVFEGSQGVLLDEWLGFHPHTTWSTTTAANAQVLLSEAGLSRGNVIGVTRTYQTRHGAGPFPSELAPDAVRFPEAHNAWGRWQGGWRAGLLDLRLLRYGVEAAGGVAEIAVTHADLTPNEVVLGYVPDSADLSPRPDQDLHRQEQFTKFLFSLRPGDLRVQEIKNFDDLKTRIEATTGVPVRYASWGPRTDQKEVLA